MVMKIPTWLAVASGLTLMGEEGVTDSTGDSSRPLETWLEKEPNCKIESDTGATTNSTATVGSPLPAKKAGIPGRPLLPMLAMVTAFDMLLSDVPLIWTGIHVVELLPPVNLVDKGRKFG